MPTIEVGRNLSRDRISAYECEMRASGELVKRKYVTGWYGIFTVERLKSELTPKLAEWAVQGLAYPFLITSHQLKDKTTIHITPPPEKRARSSDIRFSPRQQSSPQTWLAVVLSATEFKLLPPK